MSDMVDHFYNLGADEILTSIEALGLLPTGAVHALNSMENRVYDIAIEGAAPVVAKFYRPGRWSLAQIQAEHDCLLALDEAETPVIAPQLHLGKSLHVNDSGIMYCLFPKRGGRNIDEFSVAQLEQLGRLIARMHQVTIRVKADCRLKMTPKVFARNNLDYLLSEQVLPQRVIAPYSEAVDSLCELIAPLFASTTTQLIHGDLHASNLIWRDEQALLIDFDDMVIGPPVQDIWLLTPGQDETARNQRLDLLAGYESIIDFDYSTLRLIEPLRALRYIHFSTWIAKRYADPAFQRAFPYFAHEDYWLQECQSLFEQVEFIRKQLSASSNQQ